MSTDPKKSPDEAYKSPKNMVINWWSKQNLQGKFLIIIILFLGLIAVAGLSGVLGPDKYTQKINTLNQMSTILKGAQPVITDLYTSLNGYDSGSMDSNTAISRLQADILIIDGLILETRSINPPDELRHSYDLTLSALYDLRASLGLGIDGIKNDDFIKIDQSISSKDDLTKKFSELSDEISKLRASAS